MSGNPLLRRYPLQSTAPQYPPMLSCGTDNFPPKQTVNGNAYGSFPSDVHSSSCVRKNLKKQVLPARKRSHLNLRIMPKQPDPKDYVVKDLKARLASSGTRRHTSKPSFSCSWCAAQADTYGKLGPLFHNLIT